jgi:hypothetical protein
MTRARRPVPPIALLNELFTYDPETGDLIMNRRLGSGKGVGCFNTMYAGKPVTCTDRGYIVAMVGRKPFFAHRIIWKMVTGEEPPQEIDHKDLDRSNNRWSNLRAATRTTNMANTAVRADNKLRLKGAYRDHTGRYRAQIKVGERRIHLGRFDTPEAAHEAYCKAAQEHFGEHARATAD